MKRVVLILLFLCFALAIIASAQSASFAWNANTVTADPATNATGYKLHWGTQSGTYTSVLDVGSTTTATVSGLAAGTYFFAVKAYNSAGSESVASNELVLVVLMPTPTPSATPTATPVPTPTATPVPTPSPTATATPSPTATATPTPSPTVTPIPSPTPSPTPTPAGTIKIGQTAVFTNLDNGNAGLILAQSAPLLQSATIQSISFYVKSAAGTLRLGIYSSNGAVPSALKAATPVFTPVAGWNTQNVTTPVLLQAGTYWLAYAPSSSSLSFVKQVAGLGIALAPFTYGALPATFPVVTGTDPNQWSFYATLSTGPTPTPNQTPLAPIIHFTSPTP
jgi:hypothetical protein